MSQIPLIIKGKQKSLVSKFSNQGKFEPQLTCTSIILKIHRKQTFTHQSSFSWYIGLLIMMLLSLPENKKINYYTPITEKTF